GNFWAGDSGPFADNPATAGRGFQMFKFSPDGKVLLTLGKAGVSKAGPDTFVGPTACAIAPNGDLFIADGHWPRPTTAQQNGIRIGSAKDGSLKYFIEGTRPEGLAGDELGNIFAGLTGGCDASRSGGCLQKFVKKGGASSQ